MHKIKREWMILICIFAVAFAVRLATFKYPLLVYDPYHHYAIGKFIAAGNKFPDIWMLSNYPDGARITEPAGLYYVSVLLFRTLKPFGVSYLTAFKLSAPLFGALTVIPLYLLAKELFNRKTGLYSAVILAFLPAFLYRTFSGFYRGDTFSVLFMVLGFYLFLKSLKGEIKAGLGFAISAGISFGLMGLVWNGFLFGFVVLSAFTVVYSVATYLKGGNSRRMILAYVLSAGIGVVIIKYSIMHQPRVENYMRDLIRYIYPLTIAISVAIEGAKYRTGALPLRSKVYLLGFFSIIGGFFAYHYFSEVLKNLITGYGMVKATGDIMQTVSELRPPSNDMLWDKYGIVGPMALAGTFYLLKEKRLGPVTFLIIWFFASVFVMKTAIRYVFIASPPIAITGALFLHKVERKFPKKEVKALTMAVLIFVVITGATFASEQRPNITGEWVGALEFLQTQEPGAVFTWWDYGSWIQGITGFPTTLDTVTGQNAGKIKTVGRILLEKNGSKAMEGLRALKVDYAIIPVDMVGQMTNLGSIVGVDKSYQYPIFIKTANVRVNDISAERYGNNMYVLNIGADRVVAVENGGKLYAFKRVYWREDGILVKREYQDFTLPLVDKTVYISKDDLLIPRTNINDFLIPIDSNLDGTLLTSLMLLDGEGFEGIKLLYDNSQVKIYKVSR